MKASEQAWADASFNASHWNNEPTCDECGGEINEDGDCDECGAPMLTDGERAERLALAQYERNLE